MVFKILKLLFFLLFIYLLILCINNDDTVEINLKNICNDAKSSYYTFIYEDRNVTVYDMQNTLKHMFFNKKGLVDKLFISCDKERKFINIRTGAILKSEKDSIDVEPTYEKLHGYMGVWTKNNCYNIEKNGKIKVCSRKISVRK